MNSLALHVIVNHNIMKTKMDTYTDLCTILDYEYALSTRFVAPLSSDFEDIGSIEVIYCYLL